MPGKKKKYNSRFPPARIKKIMQSDEEIGKVAAAVPVIISRAIERFITSLLSRAGQVTLSKNVRTLTPSHIKQSILSQPRLDFMLNLCKDIPDNGSDPTPQGFQLPSNSVVKTENKEEMETVPNVRENLLKRSFSAPVYSLPKRKRGRPRKVVPYVDENGTSVISNSATEGGTDFAEAKRPTLNSSVSTLSLSDSDQRNEDASFVDNVKISIPGFSSSSVTIGKSVQDTGSNLPVQPLLPNPQPFNPFTSSANVLNNIDTELDEDYD